MLPDIGFKFKSVSENRKVLIERNDNRAWRAHYLRTVKDFRTRGYQTVYLDETWINKNHCLNKTWLPICNTNDIVNLVRNKNLQLPKIPSGKGTRLIVLHAGCAEIGFIPGCDMVFIGKDVDGDYHKEMSSVVFLDWFRNTLIPSLEKPSLIVLDNASYHNTRSEDCRTPTSGSRKAEMQEWLSDKGIQFHLLATKVELYELIKRHKPPIRYVTDGIAGQ